MTKNSFTFKANLEGQPEGFSGELNGDAIVLWRDRNGKVDALTLKRAATSLTGKWQGQTPNGFSLALDLVEDQGLTGTLTREGESAPITSGKVSKNTFTFTATLDGAAETVEGTVGNNEMKAWLTRRGPSAQRSEAGEMTNRAGHQPSRCELAEPVGPGLPDPANPADRVADRPILAPARLFQHYPLRHPSRVDRPDRERGIIASLTSRTNRLRRRFRRSSTRPVRASK